MEKETLDKEAGNMEASERSTHWIQVGLGAFVRCPAEVECDVVPVNPGVSAEPGEGVIQARRVVCDFSFKRLDEKPLPGPFDPPVELMVIYTPDDWDKKREDKPRLCKRVGDNWEDAERVFKNFRTLYFYVDEPEKGGLGLVYITNPEDPRIGWY